MTLEIYNTLTKEKEEFVPLSGNNINIYVCGPTAFETDGPTLNYAREAIFFDVLRTYLKEMKYDISSAMNITDYNVAIVEKADELGITQSEVIDMSVEKYFEDMEELRVEDYSEYPRATGHVDGIRSLVKLLLDEGFAYKTENAIYLDVSKVEEEKGYIYGTLSGKMRNPEDIKQREDLRGRDEKDDPRDFLVWKFEDENEEGDHTDLWFYAPELGNGKKGGPGWHSECIAMIKGLFGGEIDIHGGRTDHIQTHHENEIIQNEAAYGKNNGVHLAKYWLHSGLVNYDGMDGWNVTLRELMKENDSSTIRYAFLMTTYRKNMKLNQSKLTEARKKVEGIKRVISKVKELQETAKATEEDVYIKELIGDANTKFRESMNDNLHTPKALYSIDQLSKQLNKDRLLDKLGKKSLDDISNYYDGVNKILKIF